MNHQREESNKKMGAVEGGSSVQNNKHGASIAASSAQDLLSSGVENNSTRQDSEEEDKVTSCPAETTKSCGDSDISATAKVMSKNQDISGNNDTLAPGSLNINEWIRQRLKDNIGQKQQMQAAQLLASNLVNQPSFIHGQSQLQPNQQCQFNQHQHFAIANQPQVLQHQQQLNQIQQSLQQSQPAPAGWDNFRMMLQQQQLRAHLLKQQQQGQEQQQQQQQLINQQYLLLQQHQFQQAAGQLQWQARMQMSNPATYVAEPGQKRQRASLVTKATDSKPAFSKPAFKKRKAEQISKYKGVTWHKRDQKWMARVWMPNLGRVAYLGTFLTEADAASAIEQKQADMRANKDKEPATENKATIKVGPSIQSLDQAEESTKSKTAVSKVKKQVGESSDAKDFEKDTHPSTLKDAKSTTDRTESDGSRTPAL